MADNSAKMGTSMEAIQNAYNGFAKGQYTMLDNLKLGHGKLYCRSKSGLTVLLTGVHTLCMC
jgi:phage-related protein